MAVDIIQRLLRDAVDIVIGYFNIYRNADLTCIGDIVQRFS